MMNIENCLFMITLYPLLVPLYWIIVMEMSLIVLFHKIQIRTEATTMFQTYILVIQQ